MSANNNLGTAGVALYADTADFSAGMDKAGAIAEREMRRVARESAMAERIVSELGRRMQLGAQIAEGSGAAFRRQSETTRQASQQMAEGGRSARQMAQGMQALALQSNDVFVSLASGQSPLTVLIQQGAQVTQAFGGIRETFAGIGSLFTIGRTAALGLGAGVAYAAYQMYVGSEAAKAYERALLLNGNAAGMTEQRTRDMAASLQVSTGATALAAREAVTAIASTGRVSGQALQESARALIAYQRLSGATTEEALKLFDRQAGGAAKWAADVNRSYNFLTAAEYRRIKAMEEAGDKLGALRETNAIFARELETRDLPNLGYLATAYRTWGQWIDWAKNKLQTLGQGPTLQEQLKAAEATLSQMQTTAESTFAGSANRPANLNELPAFKRQRELIENLRARIALQDAGARASAEIAQREQAAIEAETTKTDRLAEAKRRAAEAERVYQELIRNAQRGTESPRTIADFRQLEAGQYEDTARELAERQAREAAAARERAVRDAAELERERADLQRVFAETEIANRQRAEAEARRTGPGGFREGVNSEAQRWWDEQMDRTKRGSELFKSTFKGMEDAVASWARNGKIDVADFWGSMAEVAVRELTRIAQQIVFFNSAGQFMGSGSLISSALSFFNIPGFANGLPYVPYDGMPAILHEGERVLTRQENLMGAAAGGRGGPTFDFSGQRTVVGPGVSMAQVQASVDAGNARLEARLRRLMAEQRF